MPHLEAVRGIDEVADGTKGHPGDLGERRRQYTGAAGATTRAPG
jgi:hypothetical protein